MFGATSALSANQKAKIEDQMQPPGGIVEPSREPLGARPEPLEFRGEPLGIRLNRLECDLWTENRLPSLFYPMFQFRFEPAVEAVQAVQ